MVFALNQKTFERLKELFEAHEIERSYTAVIEGQFLSAHPEPGKVINMKTSNIMCM